MALRKAFNRAHAYPLLWCWCVAATAQETVAKIDFTGNLEFYDLTTWGFILLWSGIGTAGRFKTEYASGNVTLSFWSIAGLVASSISAGLLSFSAAETVCQYYNYLPSSTAVGTIVMVGSYFNTRTFDLAKDAASSFAQWLSNRLPRKE